MKKMLVCCVAFLFFAAFANAAVNVEIGGKTKKYPDGSILKIAAKKKTVVKYSNFNIVIPRGSNFIMDCESDMVTFKGKFDKPVKLNSYTLSTNFENNDFSVTTDGNVKVNEGSVEITDEQIMLPLQHRAERKQSWICLPKNMLMMLPMTEYMLWNPKM